MTPRVSVCIPNLNTVAFLQERFDSVFRQTYPDWELFVYDSYSDDGSWELIQKCAATDSRVRLAQGPRNGPYPAWNECVAQTSGEFVYIATSDDSMAPDFLEKMVAALEKNPDCELAHSPLVVVDHDGREVPDHSWPACTIFAEGMEYLAKTPHVRHAPYDGLLQLTGRHTVLSITQLLIRRSLFSKTGPFTARWGSVSDFYWEMRAGLTTNTVHVPDTWATWRVRPNQASASVSAHSFEYYSRLEDMIAVAVSECGNTLPEAVQGALKSELSRTRDLRAYYATLREMRSSVLRRRVFQLEAFIGGSVAVRREILARILGKESWSQNAPAQTGRWLESLGLSPITLTSGSQGSRP